MATKTFKIGLSDTDKQNMAQDVYERLLALTFSEYNSSETYNTGDFVVYDDALYQCQEDNVSGAWDSTKWASATLQDLLDDVESAVDSVADKANVDGNYPTMTVGVAEQLSPYDEDSGDDQDEPFILQGTGTANGTQSDFSTGAIALMKEKQGNTIVVNQLFNYVGKSSTTVNYVSITNNNDGTFTVNGTADGGNAYFYTDRDIKLLANHKYLVLGCPSGGSISTYMLICSPQIDANVFDYGNGVILTPTVNNNAYLTPQVKEDATANNLKFRPLIIDLTKWFNGDIPQDILDNPSNFYRYYQGSLAYNTGTLVNANGRYIKCIGRNVCDEIFEQGSIDSSGQDVASSSSIRTKYYQRVIPNTTYHYRYYQLNDHIICYYDKDKNFIMRGIFNQAEHNFATPANACYIRVRIDSQTSYNNSLTISIYYEDESGYDQYYPYQVLTNNDTGTETLLAYDKKTPDGTINRNTGVLQITSSTSINRTSFSGVDYFRISISDCVLANSGDDLKPICNKYVAIKPTTISQSNFPNKTIMYLISSNSILIRDDSITSVDDFHTDYDNVLEFSYHLNDANKTTEQGTPYSENLVIDDFGSMDFAGTNGVPQGNLIFYPVDYKAFIDTLYNYTDGTPSNIALKSDLSADKSELQVVDTQLFANIGGLLRHQLEQVNTIDFANTDYLDLSDLTFTRTGSGLFQSTSVVPIKAVASNDDVGNLLCPLYKTVKFNVMYGPLSGTPGPDMVVGINTTGYLYINNTSYSDATAFKNAMKGVLLAYEKASS